jgi:hypothetical protein
LSLKIGDATQSGRIVDTVPVRGCNMKKKTEGKTIPLNPAAKTALVNGLTSSFFPEFITEVT